MEPGRAIGLKPRFDPKQGRSGLQPPARRRYPRRQKQLELQQIPSAEKRSYQKLMKGE
jgi:hypothetical protein